MNDIDAALGRVRKAVRGMAGYVPGLQPAPGQRLVKLNTNENPYPPCPGALAAIAACADPTVRLYPSPRADALREAAASTYGLAPGQVLCGNGSDEVLAIIMRTFVDKGDTVAFFQPSYSLYPSLVQIEEGRMAAVHLPRAAGAAEVEAIPLPSPKAKIFFLTTPNAPYGFAFPNSWIARLIEGFPGIVVADEAYADFARESALSLLADSPRLIVVRTFSKTYSLAGMRVGFGFAHETLIEQMMKVKDSYNLSRPAQAAACAALADQGYLKDVRERIISTRERFACQLAALGFAVVPSQANFLFAVPPAEHEAKRLYESLLSRGFLVRYFSTPDISDGLRISIGADDDMERLARAIEEVLHGRR